MKQFFDFIPLIVFFAVYKFVDIYAATGALIVVTGLMVLYTYLRHKTVERMHLITFLMVTVFGGLTLFLQDDAFIKWKVTVVYGIFALALLISQFIMKKPLLKSMLGKELQLPEKVWSRLNSAWATFFIVCGALNVYVAFELAQETWVNFKVFGLLGMTLAFTVACGFYLYPHLPQESKDTEQG